MCLSLTPVPCDGGPLWHGGAMYLISCCEWSLWSARCMVLAYMVAELVDVLQLTLWFYSAEKLRSGCV